MSSMFYNKNVLDWLAPDARNAMTRVRILSLTLDFYITFFIYTSFATVLFFAGTFATVLTVEPREYIEYKIKDGFVSF